MNIILEHIAIIILTVLLVISIIYNVKNWNTKIGFESSLDGLRKFTAEQRNHIFQKDEIIHIYKKSLLDLASSVRFKKQMETGYDEEWVSWEVVTAAYVDKVNWNGKTYHSEAFFFGDKEFVIKFEPQNNHMHLRGIPRVIEKEKCVNVPK